MATYNAVVTSPGRRSEVTRAEKLNIGKGSLALFLCYQIINTL
jgi:hypothetical protein